MLGEQIQDMPESPAPARPFLLGVAVFAPGIGYDPHKAFHNLIFLFHGGYLPSITKVPVTKVP
jgi:hypothetical protein